MRRPPVLIACLTLLLAPVLLGAQDIVIQGGDRQPGAAILREVLLRPHVIVSGSGPLVIPRDTAITQSLVVLGRPTYLAGRVTGDVVVVGSDLYLRPGVQVSGRAIAIGGTVSSTMLGRVGGAKLSFRDETYEATRSGTGFVLTFRDGRAATVGPARVQLSGIKGVQIPSYDRVDGVSLPVGVQVTLAEGAIQIDPSVTYRSRLGVIDPGVDVRVGPDSAIHFQGRVARETRSNDRWIRGDLINSLSTFFNGTDERNWFRSDLAEGRVIARIDATARRLEPFIGARVERVSPIRAAGNVYTILKSDSAERRFRFNPLVEPGQIASALLGVDLHSTGGLVGHQLRAELEQSFHVPAATSQFTQLTLHGTVDFPTFGTQHLYTRAHAVLTSGASVPLARYAYLGGGGTLPFVFLLAQGGTDLVFVDTRYHIPIESIMLPVVGPPVLILRHIIGGVDVGRVGSLEDNVGAGVGLGPLRLEVLFRAAGRPSDDSSHVKFGVGLSFSP